MNSIQYFVDIKLQLFACRLHLLFCISTSVWPTFMYSRWEKNNLRFELRTVSYGISHFLPFKEISFIHQYLSPSIFWYDTNQISIFFCWSMDTSPCMIPTSCTSHVQTFVFWHPSCIQLTGVVVRWFLILTHLRWIVIFI